MNLVIPLSGEDAATMIVGVLEYNGFKPESVKVFGRPSSRPDAMPGEFDLERVEVTCAGIVLKVKNVPDEEAIDPVYGSIQARRKKLIDDLARARTAMAEQMATVEAS